MGRGGGGGGGRGGGGRAGRGGATSGGTLPSLDTLGPQIQQIADDLPAWSGSEKVFISDIKAEYRSRFGDFDDAAFNQALMEGNRQEFFITTRADLTSAMPQDKVNASFIQAGTLGIHFVRKSS